MSDVKIGTTLTERQQTMLGYMIGRKHALKDIVAQEMFERIVEAHGEITGEQFIADLKIVAEYIRDNDIGARLAKPSH